VTLRTGRAIGSCMLALQITLTGWTLSIAIVEWMSGRWFWVIVDTLFLVPICSYNLWRVWKIADELHAMKPKEANGNKEA
jgi:hypothetical protein